MKKLILLLFLLVPFLGFSQIVMFETTIKIDGQEVATLTEDANRDMLIDFLKSLVLSAEVTAQELEFDVSGGNCDYVEVIGGDLSQEYGYISYPNGVKSMYLTRNAGEVFYGNSALPAASVWIAADVPNPLNYDFKIVAIPK